tara:strand:+ start:3632 stop:6046 length:2415 start_codon:yes stop_codon:yes gene_type:complete
MPSVALPWSLVTFICPHATDADPLSKEDESRLRTAAKAMLEQSIEAGLDPLAADQDDIIVGHQMNLTVDSAKSRTVRKIAKTHKRREGGVLTGYLIAAQKKDMHLPFAVEPAERSRLTPYLESVGHQPRTEQTLFFNNLMDSVEGHKVGLIEGGTGIGKTLAMLASANEVALSQVTKCNICVPTLSLIYQFASEYARLAKNAEMAPLKVVMGMREFVDIEALRKLLDEPDYSQHKEVVDQWLEAGAPASGRAENIRTTHLVESLSTLVPELPVSEFRLSPLSEDDEPGLAVYKAQFEDITDAPAILLTTHAMVAVDLLFKQRQRWKSGEASSLSERFQHALDSTDASHHPELFDEYHYQVGMIIREEKLGHLPFYTHLWVDEAHLFEQSISNALSDQVSLWALLNKTRDVMGESFVKRHALKEKFEKIKALAVEDTIEIGDATEAQLSLRTLLLGFLDALASSRSKDKHKRAIRDEARNLVDKLNKLHYGMMAFLSFSPVRKYPQLHVGSRSFDKMLKQLWYAMDGAACVSASLYYKKMDEDSASYYKNRLAIPEEKAKEYTPVMPSWHKTPVKHFYLPKSASLLPVSRSDRLSDEAKAARVAQWLQANAEWVTHIQASAAGGTLVLLTSHADATAFYDMLKDSMGIDASRLVAGLGIHSLNEQKATFVARSLRGEKPIWLAVGSAWTGLDINGSQYGIDDPSQDNLLTDLVIPKLPFGLNRTISHRHFVNRQANGSTIEALEAAMLFKQGIGRLVRREGLPCNRRIWVLDNRLHEKRFKGFLYPVTRFMDTYTTSVIESVEDL